MQRLNKIKQYLSSKKLQNEQEYLRINKFAFRKITSKHRSEALHLVAFGYTFDNPFPVALKEKYPHLNNTYQQNKLYWSHFIDQTLTNGLSVGVFDTEDNDKLVAQFLNVDSNYSPKEAEKLVENPNNAAYYDELTISELKKLTLQKFPFLFNSSQKNLTSLALIVLIDRKYQGQKLMLPMLLVSEVVVKQAGYQYLMLESTHAATKNIGLKAGYNSECEVDSKRISVKMKGKNEFPYSEIGEAHRYVSCLWKKL